AYLLALPLYLQRRFAITQANVGIVITILFAFAALFQVLLLQRVLAVTAPTPGARLLNDWRIARAKAFAELGQSDQAIAEVQAAVNAGWRAGYGANDSMWLDETPSMAKLRTDPRFKALMARVRQDLARQRAAVLATRR
ncbi:MAG: hypothetical protein ACHP7A_06775, partial [Caulobacterales bacterium]